MFDVSSFTALPLFTAIGIIAGIIESSSGGSGLIVTPLLLMLGLSPASAMATSKLQYTFGAMTSITRFHQARLVRWRSILPLAAITALCGAAGALTLVQIKPTVLVGIVPAMLFAATCYFIFSPRLSDTPHPHPLPFQPLLLAALAIVGFYDGFFGVGSGSFYVLLLIWGCGLAAREATAAAKIVDFSSASAALAILASRHEVLWLPGLALGCGQIIGAWIGAGLVIRRGARFIRPMLVVMSFALSLKLCYDYRAQLLDFLK